jgi:hypothetical protein
MSNDSNDSNVFVKAKQETGFSVAVPLQSVNIGVGDGSLSSHTS